jgi:hypothetical protein
MVWMKYVSFWSSVNSHGYFQEFQALLNNLVNESSSYVVVNKESLKTAKERRKSVVYLGAGSQDASARAVGFSLR